VKRTIGWALALLAAVALLLLAGRALTTHVIVFAAWVEELGPWGPLAFMAGYAVGTVAMVPGSILTLAAGAVFGLLHGGVYVFVGATAGAAAAFLIARYLAREPVARRVSTDPRFAAIDRAIARDGRRIVLLLRLSPIFPYNLLNYALGLSRIRFSDYLLASLGMIPGIVLYVYAGVLAGDLTRLAAGIDVPRGPLYYLVLGIGFLATLAVTLLVTRRARDALREVAP
jgi:uncharacterized membrane protein YdjX (TVP38/TMEM64 family)